GAAAVAEVRPRGGARVGGRDVVGLFPPLPAQHLHRAADARDDGRGLPPGPAAERGDVMDNGAMTDAGTQHAITVLGHDRPGIIAWTTDRLAGLGLNIEDSSMTLLRGHFAMTLICA